MFSIVLANAKIPKILVVSQIETKVHFGLFQLNIRDHLWRWSIYFGLTQPRLVHLKCAIHFSQTGSCSKYGKWITKMVRVWFLLDCPVSSENAYCSIFFQVSYHLVWHNERMPHVMNTILEHYARKETCGSWLEALARKLEKLASPTLNC